MNFKHKQKVTCEIDGVKITDARISIRKDGMPFICQNEKDGCEAEDKLEYKYSWKLNRDFTDEDVKNLKPVKETIRDAEVGDIIEDMSGNKRMILDVREKIVAVSYFDNYKAFAYFYTFDELEKDGYKLVKPEELEEPEESEEIEDDCEYLKRTITKLGEICEELERIIKK